MVVQHRPARGPARVPVDDRRDGGGGVARQGPVCTHFHDVPLDVIEEGERRGEPGQSWTPITQPWPLDAWPATPARVLAGRDDRLFPEAFQRRIARERLGIEAETIPRAVTSCRSPILSESRIS